MNHYDLRTEQDLGAMLRRLRLEAQLTQRDLALRIGSHEPAVSSIERGERAPSVQYLSGFVAALNVGDAVAAQIWQLYRLQPVRSDASVAPTATGPCPYRGLLAFREEDARLYYGREGAVRRVMRKLTDGQLVAIVGASGSGKSSAVFAGVVPLLRQRDRWDVVSLRPGSDPLDTLYRALSGFPSSRPDIDGILAAVKARTPKRGAGLLIVVDQFEELYTHSSEEDSISLFLDALVAVANTKTMPPAKIVLTFRGDFYGRVITHRAFSDALQDSVVHLPPMSRSELRRAITEPARVVGLKFEDGLADRILDDAGLEPGNLPLLEFTLTRLWEQQRGSALTHEAYERVGGLFGALTARAEDVYTGLSPEGQYAARQLLVRLVHVARPEEDGNDARRRTPLSEVQSVPQSRDVVRALADARLVVTDDEGSLGPTVELAHEAIIRSWERLRGWLVEDRQFLLWQQRVRQWMDEWRHAQDADSALLRGGILEEAVRWTTAKGREAIAADLLDYLDASILEFEAETRRQALARIDQLLTVRPMDVPDLAASIVDKGPDLRSVLRQRLQQALPTERWRVRVALLSSDPGQAVQLLEEIDMLAPDELIAVKDAARGSRAALESILWAKTMQHLDRGESTLHGAILLADYAPADSRWHRLAPPVAREIVEQNQLHLRTLVDALRPVREQLFEPLFQIFAETVDRRAAVRETTALILLDLAADQPTLLARMAADALPQSYERIFATLHRAVGPDAIQELQSIASAHPEEDLSEHQRVALGRRRALALTTLLRLHERVDINALFVNTGDPELLTQLTFQARDRGIPADDLAVLLADTTTSTARYVLLLALGEYQLSALSGRSQENVISLVAAIHEQDDDPGVHSASAWLARRWGVPLPKVNAPYDPTGRRGWFTLRANDSDLTFVVFQPGHFVMGSPDNEEERSDYESPPQPTTLTRRFAFCTREVTRAEFERFMNATKTHGLPNIDEWSPTGAEPVVAPTWFEAVSYNDWLTDRLKTDPSLGWARLRLPTEAEWEYACRAMAKTAFSFGSDRSLLRHYGWFADNSGLRTHEAGTLRPHPAGLFHIHGQCWEWCSDWYAPYSRTPVVDPHGPQHGERKVLRGGCWNLSARYARCACRNAHIPSNRNYYITFRLAMTLPEIGGSQ